jgi:hypothetical protein
MALRVRPPMGICRRHRPDRARLFGLPRRPVMADQLTGASAFARLTSHSADFGPMTLAAGAFWVLGKTPPPRCRPPPIGQKEAARTRSSAG